MNAEPAGLDRNRVASLLRAWDLSVASLDYLPVGAGSHHYLAVDDDGRRWFVTVDELVVKLFGMGGPTFVPWVDVDLDAAFSALDRAFRTAAALHGAGLDFVHAPIAQPDGSVLARLGNFAVSVFPIIDEITADGIDGQGRRRLLELVGRVHAATDAVRPDLPQRDSLMVPLKPQFLEAVDDLGSRWTNGPYGERARRLLEGSVDAVLELFVRCEDLAEQVRTSDRPWVLTHGQMHGGNIVGTASGSLILVDWDCVAVSPRERDLGTWGNGLEPTTEGDWSAYCSAGEPRGIDASAVELYRLLGLLWGVCTDTYVFRGPHADDADARHEWRNLVASIARITG